MKTSRLLVAGILVFALTAGIRAEKKDEKQDDAKLLIGTWKVTTADTDAPLDIGDSTEFSQDGKNKTTRKKQGKEVVSQGTYKFEKEKLVITVKSEKGVSETVLTIKKITDTELVISNDEGGKVVEFRKCCPGLPSLPNTPCRGCMAGYLISPRADIIMAVFRQEGEGKSKTAIAEDNQMAEPLGTLKFAGCTLPVTRASFGFVADGNNDPRSDEEVPGWDFDVCTGPPLDPPPDESLSFLLSTGMRFYSESDPIPLANAEDLTGSELRLAEPFDPVSGEVYFTVYLGEHNDVSDLTLRFVERRGAKYRMQVSALVHSVFEAPTRFEIDTWIDRSTDR